MNEDPLLMLIALQDYLNKDKDKKTRDERMQAGRIYRRVAAYVKFKEGSVQHFSQRKIPLT